MKRECRNEWQQGENHWPNIQVSRVKLICSGKSGPKARNERRSRWTTGEIPVHIRTEL